MLVGKDVSSLTFTDWCIFHLVFETLWSVVGFTTKPTRKVKTLASKGPGKGSKGQGLDFALGEMSFLTRPLQKFLLPTSSIQTVMFGVPVFEIRSSQNL